MGPEYPGLDESVEYARWRILHWIQQKISLVTIAIVL
jgi:hypothetical protein